MLATLANFFFGCVHRRTTFPITPNRARTPRKQASQFETYVVCLDCGKEFPYSWEEMRIVSADTPQETAQVSQPTGFLSILK